MSRPSHPGARGPRALAIALALVALMSCGDAARAPDDARPTSSAQSAAPSSSEGAMCREHGVLEAICTKCNPKLIAVFRAKGDYCEEHGFPESVCPICHPERGGRPALSVARDDAPPHGLRVKFRGVDTARLAGIETAVVEARPGASAVVAVARIVPDATKVARVNARSPGIVRSLQVDVGAVVKKGDALLAIDSPEVGANRARLEAARSRVELSEENYARAAKLAAEGIASQKSVRAEQQELAAARAEYAALAASLSVLGPSSEGAGAYTLRAPLAGVVTERHATMGELVNGSELLLEIVDTSTVWAELDVAEADLGLVAQGQTTILRFESFADRDYSGTVAFIAPVVDVHTRTAKARVALANPDGVLRANLYGEARIAAGATRTTLSVPRAALQKVRGVDVVFVALGKDEFELRRVKIGAADAARVEVLTGLHAAEVVVTTGSFLLKTETLKESIGAGCCDAD